jgi:hypothetical protein
MPLFYAARRVTLFAQRSVEYAEKLPDLVFSTGDTYLAAWEFAGRYKRQRIEEFCKNVGLERGIPFVIW